MIEFNKDYFEGLRMYLEKVDKTSEEIDDYMTKHNYATLPVIPGIKYTIEKGDLGQVKESLNAVKREIEAFNEQFKYSLNLLHTFGVEINDKDKVEEQFNEMNERIINICKKFSDALIKKQQNCEHEWSDDGHDSHYTYYTCTKCGATKRE